MKERGKFIVIEGLDGSGSTIQVGLLTDFLKLNAIDTVQTKEPTDNVIGSLIRGALTGVYSLPPASIQFLFSADRGHHLNRLIEPKIEGGCWVVSDRYMWSTIAYGSVDLDRMWLLETQKYFLKPDLTIFLKVSPRECIKRITKNRYDIELFEKEKKLKKVWDCYSWLAKKFPREVKVVDGEGSEREIFERILHFVQPLIKNIS